MQTERGLGTSTSARIILYAQIFIIYVMYDLYLSWLRGPCSTKSSKVGLIWCPRVGLDQRDINETTCIYEG